jgi:hypothetical protein
LAGSSLLGATRAAAQEADDGGEGPSLELEPDQVVTGVVDPGTEDGDLGRDVGNALLWLPRNTIDYTFRGTSAAARFIADEQIVPRYRQWVGAPLDGNFFVFPVFFADTGSTASAGLRMISDSRYVTTSQRFGIGGPRDIVTESRVLFKGGEDLPFAIAIEAYYEINSSKQYYGVGLRPGADPRNRFVSGNPNDRGRYVEKHARGIGTLGMRLSDNSELFLSTSIYRRQISDKPGAGDESLDEVFEPGSIPGAYVPGDGSAGRRRWMTYSEMAARFDSRRFRGRPAPGALVEGYAGGAHSFNGEPVAFMRVGWRVAGFFPIYRKTNILSPRLVVDRLLPLNNSEIPFNEIPQQPDFRGVDIRRDNLSMVMSLDYTWQLVTFMSMRTFIDAASVAPSVPDIGLTQLKNMRFAGGIGLDFYTATAIISQIAVSMSGDGPRLFFSLGNPEGFGDRQHRD